MPLPEIERDLDGAGVIFQTRPEHGEQGFCIVVVSQELALLYSV